MALLCRPLRMTSATWAFFSTLTDSMPARIALRGGGEGSSRTLEGPWTTNAFTGISFAWAKLLPRRPPEAVETSRARPRARDGAERHSGGHPSHRNSDRDTFAPCSRNFGGSSPPSTMRATSSVRAVAAELMASPSESVRCAIAFLFPNEPAWARARPRLRSRRRCRLRLRACSTRSISSIRRSPRRCTSIFRAPCPRQNNRAAVVLRRARREPDHARPGAGAVDPQVAEKSERNRSATSRSVSRRSSSCNTPEVGDSFAARPASPGTRASAAGFFALHLPFWAVLLPLPQSWKARLPRRQGRCPWGSSRESPGNGRAARK